MAIIAEQNFNLLSDQYTFTSDSLLSGTSLNNLGSFNTNSNQGLVFETFWFDTRGNGNGPAVGSESGDNIGVNSFTGSNAPNIAADGTTIASGIEHNYQFEDGDGRLDLVFQSVDLSNYNNRFLSFNYWIADTGYESNDFFIVTLSDGNNSQTVLNFSEIELETNASADNSTANWNTFNLDLDNLINNGLGNNLSLTISVDTNAASEKIFVDNILFTGDESGNGNGGSGGTSPSFVEDFNSFTGSGFSPNPNSGQLDSDIWIVTGFSNGSLNFGDTVTSGDFARGSDDGGVSTGGVYGFNVSPENTILGIQPTGGDFTPGEIILKLQNDTGSTVNEIDINYDIWYRNDQNRANSLNFAYSYDGVNFVTVSSLDFTTPETADNNGWQSEVRSATLSGLNIADDQLFYLKWTGDDISGSGSRDEYGIDNIQVTQLTVAGVTPPPPPPEDITKIHTIQGTGLQSSFIGQTVTVEAIVVGDFQGSDGLRGFYLQEEDSDIDSSPLTSEGIFVFDGSLPTVDVTVGDKVKLTGVVSEFSSGGTSLTELSNLTDVTVVSTGNSLPTAVTINDLKSANSSSIGLENYEGMRINFDETLTLTEYFQLGRFGQVTLSSGGRLYQPTNVTTPGAAANALQADNDLRRIVLDDGSSRQNVDPILFGRNGQSLSSTNILRGGDTVTGLSGILDQRFGDYRLQTNTSVNFQAVNDRTITAPEVGGTLKIANYNVLNYFTTIDNGSNGARGADTASEFQRQQDKLLTALTEIDADILGLVEIENNGDVAVSNLVNELNSVTNPGTYDYIATGSIGTDAIKVALIYKTDVVNPVGNFAILDSSVDPTFQDNRNRPALAQTFEEIATGEKVTLAVNHFKSKGSSGLTNTNDPNFDQGDGQGFWNATRTDAANALVNWLANDPTNSGDNDYLIIGDLNAYAMEDPITAIKNAGYTNLIEQFNGLDAYSYVFDGQFGYLDHALSNSSLTPQVTGVAEWHINADEPNVFDYNEEFNPPSLYSVDPYRTSDHDPVLIGLNLGNYDFIEGTTGGDILIGTNQNEVITGLQGMDMITTGGGSDRLVYNSVNDGLDMITDFTVGNDSFVFTKLLDSLGYNGGDPISDGYINFISYGADTMISIDPDGNNGSGLSRDFIYVENVAISALNNTSNFVF
ncbi:ExeM/NucH family extracellular endonuclease [Crocosphaera sp.]|uniref:ExeM/NucH family extracellular endonuclease n=1 Tax=Crocosphaera sp. TaxID=2729996 RepID=UPI003F243BB0|nr:ExeM/NucH family extracellular endonuclease [Crocosphaera sp.]